MNTPTYHFNFLGQTVVLMFLLAISFLPGKLIYASYFTLPIEDTSPDSISSYFDHDYPDYTTTGEMHRYDGVVFTGSDANLNTCTSGEGCYDGHNGTDFEGDYSDNIFAAHDGEVKDVYWNNLSGWTVHVYHDDIGLSTLYAHVATTTVATTTDVVKRYDPVAYMDSTGSMSTGPHLHFGVVDDEELSGNRIDPFGWSGTTTDPWPHNQGYLWTTNPPSLCDTEGNTTSTFFPSLDSVLHSGWNYNWNTTRNGYNVNVFDNIASVSDFRLSDWYNGLTLYRFHSEFDTSSIDDKDVLSASLYINFSSVSSGNLSSHNGWVVSPSNYIGTTADAKWDSYTSAIGTAYSNEGFITSPSGYTEFELNENGTSSISTSSTTKLGIVSYWDQINADPSQSYGAFKSDYGTALFSEQVGTTLDPKLTVTHSCL